MTVLTDQTPARPIRPTHRPRIERDPIDAELLREARDGDPRAFGQLWQRHVSSVRRAVTQFTGFDADDVTAEAFTRTLSALKRGYGPRDGFRSYVVAAARNTATEWSRRLREVSVNLSIWEVVDESVIDRASTPVVNADLALLAFTRLPERWQQILWHTEIEGRKPTDIAPLLGLTANGAAALALRAREGLRQEWAMAHLQPSTLRAGHDWYVERAAKYARGKSGPRDAARIEQHLSVCSVCCAIDTTLQTVLAELARGGASRADIALRRFEATDKPTSVPSGRSTPLTSSLPLPEQLAAA